MSVYIEPRSQEYNSWNKLVKKTVIAEPKAYLQPFYYSCEIDNCCSKGNRSSYTILTKSQENYDEFFNKI